MTAHPDDWMGGFLSRHEKPDGLRLRMGGWNVFRQRTVEARGPAIAPVRAVESPESREGANAGAKEGLTLSIFILTSHYICRSG